MLDFEEAREYLTEIADDLPKDIFKELNGGIILVPDTKYDTDGLLILGHYHFDPLGLGRYVTIYYGSVMEVYGNSSADIIKKQLKDVLYHELTHHIEHLAGDKSLEIQDEIDKARILGKEGNNWTN